MSSWQFLEDFIGYDRQIELSLSWAPYLLLREVTVTIQIVLRRIARYALNTLTALSLLLCVATCVLWVRSYWRGDVIAFNSNRVDDREMDIRRFNALSSSARLVVWASTSQYIVTDPMRRGHTFALSPSRQSDGWSFGAYPARSPFQPAKPQFNALGLCVDLRWGKETDLRNFFLKGPNGKARTSSTYLAIPHWMVALVGLAAPTWWWFRRRQRLLRLHRLNHGLCLSCGYDLRASPVEGGALVDRCPECGTAAMPSRAGRGKGV